MIEAYSEMTQKLPMQFQLESYEITALCEYICDTEKDLENLPSDCTIGSTARVINPLSTYKKIADGKWTIQQRYKQDGS